MPRTKTKSTKRNQLAVSCRQQCAERQKLLALDLRRWTETEILLRILPQRRPSTGLGTLSLSKGRGRREFNFCLSGDDDKQKQSSNWSYKFLPNRRLPIGQKGFPQRTLRLCGEVSESLSAIISENLRLKLFVNLALWRENFVKIVLLSAKLKEE